MLTEWEALALWREGQALWGHHHPQKNYPGAVAAPGARPALVGAELASARLPVPCPWLVETIVSAVGVNQLAAILPDGPARSQMQESADAAIAQILDGYCGTSPRLVPWPWPGPPPWAYEIASELAIRAYTTHGNMRDALLAIAAQVVAVNPQPLPPGQ